MPTTDHGRALIAEMVGDLADDLVTARKPVRQEFHDCVVAAFDTVGIGLDDPKQFEEVLAELLKELQRAWA